MLQVPRISSFLIPRPSQHLLQNLNYKVPRRPEILGAIESSISLLGHDNVYCCRKLPTSDAIPHRAVILKFSPAYCYFTPFGPNVPPPHQTSSQTASILNHLQFQIHLNNTGLLFYRFLEHRSCHSMSQRRRQSLSLCVNPLNPELNPICYLLALLGAHHFLHLSRIRVKLLTFRRLMSYIYIYGAPILDVSRSHTTTQHSR